MHHLPSTSKLNSVNPYLPLTQTNTRDDLVSQHHKFWLIFFMRVTNCFCLFFKFPVSRGHPEKLCDYFCNFKSPASQVEHKQTKALLRKVKYKLMEGEASVCDFDWIIGLSCFILKLCVYKPWIAAQNVIFSLCLVFHRANEFAVVKQ